MGTDMYSYAEVRTGGRWRWIRGISPNAEVDFRRDCVFEGRDYGMFGFLADVRNLSHSPVIADPRGLPEGISADLLAENDGDYYPISWLTLAELLAYDYEQEFWDRRITRGNDGGALAGPGEGRTLTLREFLSEGRFFEGLDLLATLGDPADVRVVFWFSG